MECNMLCEDAPVIGPDFFKTDILTILRWGSWCDYSDECVYYIPARSAMEMIEHHFTSKPNEISHFYRIEVETAREGDTIAAFERKDSDGCHAWLTGSMNTKEESGSDNPMINNRKEPLMKLETIKDAQELKSAEDMWQLEQIETIELEAIAEMRIDVYTFTVNSFRATLGEMVQKIEKDVRKMEAKYGGWNQIWYGVYLPLPKGHRLLLYSWEEGGFELKNGKGIYPPAYLKCYAGGEKFAEIAKKEICIQIRSDEYNKRNCLRIEIDPHYEA